MPFGATSHAVARSEHENFETLGMYKDAFDWKGWIRRWMKEPQESERLLEPLRKLTAKS